MSLTTWTDQLVDALGIDLELDAEAILELARDAAHAVERPAAPLTTFLVGYAAGVRGGSVEDVADCIDVATDLIETDAE
jgi:hypothetical protein